MAINSNSSVILAIDDREDNLFIIESLVSEYLSSCKVETVISAREGLRRAREIVPDIMLVDVQMPEIDGVELCRRLKNDKKLKHIPVILLTAHQTSTELKVEGLNAGADDFISKPIDNIELIARIRVLLRIKQAEDELRSQKEMLAFKVQEKINALRESETRYRTIFDKSKDAIFISDSTVKIVDTNRAACLLTGYTKEELLKIHLPDLHEAKHRIAFQNYFDRIMAGELIVSEAELLTKGGQLVEVEYSSTRFFIGAKPYIHTVARDVSAKRNAEREKKQLEARLQQAQRLEAVGTLSGGIAHDFNNILGIIIGNTELAMDDIPALDPAKAFLGEVRTASLRAKELVRQLLSFSRKSDERKEHIDIIPIVKESLKLLRSSIPTSIEFKTEFQADCLGVLADPTQIHQVVINLCTNAAHAISSEGGYIRVSVKRVSISPNECNAYDAPAPGAYVALTIRDTGEGIAAEHIDRIYEPYYTTKEIGKGSGLGLSVVHGIVKNHQGVINVQSRRGEGTTFDILLPALDSPVHPKQSQSREYPAGCERILFVDDEAAIVKLCCYGLQRVGYHVDTSVDPFEALEMIRATPEKFDLLITDMAMPGMTGTKLISEAKKIRPDLPTILCTGYSENMNEERALALGVTKYLMKPLERKDLIESVHHVLHKAI